MSKEQEVSEWNRVFQALGEGSPMVADAAARKMIGGDSEEAAMEHIKTGDTVLHKPTGEEWVVAFAKYETGRLSPCGWPEDLAYIRDCELVESCTEEERMDLLLRLSRMSGGDSRRSYAQHTLNQMGVDWQQKSAVTNDDATPG